MRTLSGSHGSSTRGQWLASIAAIVVTLVCTIFILRHAARVTNAVPVEVINTDPPPKLGVVGTITSGGAGVDVAFDALDLALRPQQPPVESLAAGNWEGEFTVTFRPGHVRYARIGARIRGGSLIVMRNNEVILSDYAGDEVRTVLTTMPQTMGRFMQQFKYIFTSDGRFDVRLQPLWQPEGADEPQPFPHP